jgi:hypothetical protein
MTKLLFALLTLLFSLSGPAMGENNDFRRCSIAANNVGKKLGNTFKGKKAAQIDEIFKANGFAPRGLDPLKSKRAFGELKADIAKNGVKDPIKYVEHNG